jgi:hypothetical protein
MPYGEARRSRPVLSQKPKNTFFFVSGSFWYFSSLFCSCHPLSFLSFGDHHYFPSRLSHRPPPPTRLGTHLVHVPLHPCTPCLCILRVVFPPKHFSSPSTLSFFCSLQSLELVFPPQSKGVSRCDCFCRFPSNPTTHLHYNFSNTSLVFFLCTVKWTQLVNPLNLGCFSKSPKEGAQQAPSCLVRNTSKLIFLNLQPARGLFVICSLQECSMYLVFIVTCCVAFFACFFVRG